MKTSKITLCFFIDAFGWEIYQRHPDFLRGLSKEEKKVKTILGYSNACDPSIISGLTPSEHGHFSSFYYSPKTSPFKWTRVLSKLPNSLIQYQRVRNQLSKFIGKISGITGYFQIYQTPIPYLRLFDYAEKRRIWGKGKLIFGKTIFNELDEKGIPYYVGDQDSEESQFAKADQLIQEGKTPFLYLLLGKLDSLMHAVGTKDLSVGTQLRNYDASIRRLIHRAEKKFDVVEWFIFSDHGMHDVEQTIDLQSEIQKTSLCFGKDYVAFYDSTMARFWYLTEGAKRKILDRLHAISKGHVLSDEELKKEGIDFPDRRYGETIFLVDPKVLIIPSFMGRKPIKGMHGYNPKIKEAYASLLSNTEIPGRVDHITDYYSLFQKSVSETRNNKKK